MAKYKEKIVYRDGNFIIARCQNRGYEPYHALKEERKFLWIKYREVIRCAYGSSWLEYLKNLIKETKEFDRD